MFVLHDFIKFLFLSGKIVSTLLTLSLGYSALLKDVRILWNMFLMYYSFSSKLEFKNALKLIWFKKTTSKKPHPSVNCGVWAAFLHTYPLCCKRYFYFNISQIPASPPLWPKDLIIVSEIVFFTFQASFERKNDQVF